MKKLKTTLAKSSESLNNHWSALTQKTQKQYVLLLFAAYLILSVSVLFKVWRDTTKLNDAPQSQPITLKKQNL